MPNTNLKTLTPVPFSVLGIKPIWGVNTLAV